MIDLVIKTKNLKTAFARLRVLGLRVNCDEEGTPLTRYEEMVEHCCTPPIKDINGDWYFTFRITDESKANKIPKQDTPNFAVIWQSNELDGEGNKLPWPEVEVRGETGTFMQGVGMIA